MTDTTEERTSAEVATLVREWVAAQRLKEAAERNVGLARARAEDVRRSLVAKLSGRRPQVVDGYLVTLKNGEVSLLEVDVHES